MRARELRDLSERELEEKERELQTELFNLRFQHATSQLDNPMRLPAVRRDLARLKTVRHERRRSPAAGEASAASGA